MTKRDNSTFTEKTILRDRALQTLRAWGIEQPAVLETHGGEGKLFNACYAHLQRGVVFEEQESRTDLLAKQRPTWAVYEADCEVALAAGVGGHVAVDLLDVDPYGSPHEALQGFFASERPFQPRMVVVVNDGLRVNISLGGAWHVEVLRPAVEKFGNDLHPIYLDVCKWMLGQAVKPAKYTVRYFSGFYAGKKKHMTQYVAHLERGE